VSRVGKAPVPIPQGVQCELKGLHLKVTGPKGTLERDLRPDVDVKIEDSEIVVERRSEAKKDRAFHGLTRALINNMVVGVSEGFKRSLQIEGVGYRVSMQGKNLNLMLGYSHPVTYEPPEGVEFEVEGQNIIRASGFDKQLVGQTAANIRNLRPPEPYKGKGVRYEGELIRRKVGKAGGK